MMLSDERLREILAEQFPHSPAFASNIRYGKSEGDTILISIALKAMRRALSESTAPPRERSEAPPPVEGVEDSSGCVFCDSDLSKINGVHEVGDMIVGESFKIDCTAGVSPPPSPTETSHWATDTRGELDRKLDAVVDQSIGDLSTRLKAIVAEWRTSILLSEIP